MRRRPAALGAALALALAGTVIVPVAGARTPGARQIARAVHAAERARSLWATVNICDTPKYPRVMGIRGQMPALGFDADLRMYFEVDYWSYAHSVFKRLKGLAQPVDLGTVRRGVYQAGVRFTFEPHVGLLRGRVRFVWRVGRRVVGSTDQLTRLGHASARYGDPPGFSSWRCVIS